MFRPVILADYQPQEEEALVLQNRSALIMRTINIAWPAILESVFIVLASTIDTLMVSALGMEAISAVGLTTQPKFVFYSPFMAIAVALSALVARRKGEGRREEAYHTFALAFALVLILCALITGICLYLADPLMRWAGSNAETHADSVLYFRIIMGGLIFNMVTNVINAAQRGSGNTQIAMVTNVVSSLTNVFCNYLLIEGHWGFPALGIQGAAIATVLGAVVACVMSILSICKPKSYIFLPHFFGMKEKWSLEPLSALGKMGIGIWIENLLMRVGFIVTAFIAARLGTVEFAAHQIGMNMLGLSFAFADGLQQAAVALTGESLGKGEKKLALTYGHLCQRIGLILSILIAIAILFGTPSFYRLHNDAENVIAMGRQIGNFLIFIVLFQISQIIYASCLRAGGDYWYTLMSSTVSAAIIRTIVTLILTQIFQLGLAGIWWGIFSDQFSRYIFLSIRFLQGKWLVKKV